MLIISPVHSYLNVFLKISTTLTDKTPAYIHTIQAQIFPIAT